MYIRVGHSGGRSTAWATHNYANHKEIIMLLGLCMIFLAVFVIGGFCFVAIQPQPQGDKDVQDSMP
jgi:hypothetical protein